jgi:DNA-binding XRE family transcriptional regulator
MGTTRPLPSVPLTLAGLALERKYPAWFGSLQAHGYRLPTPADSKHPDVSPNLTSSRLQDVNIRFGHRLRTLRMDQGLSQVDMAKRFGLDRSFISDVERGKKSPSLATLEIFALGLKITIEDLFRDV